MTEEDNELNRNMQIAAKLGFVPRADGKPKEMVTNVDMGALGEYTIFLSFTNTPKGQYWAQTNDDAKIPIGQDIVKDKVDVIKKYRELRDSGKSFASIVAGWDRIVGKDSAPKPKKVTIAPSGKAVKPHNITVKGATKGSSTPIAPSPAFYTTPDQSPIFPRNTDFAPRKDDKLSIIAGGVSSLPGIVSPLVQGPIMPKGLVEGVDFYHIRGSEKKTFTKEGMLKLARINGITSTHVDVMLNDDDRKIVRVTGGTIDGRRAEAIVDWNLKNAIERELVKALSSNPPRLHFGRDVKFVDGTLTVVAEDKMLYFASRMVDVKEFALRSIIGKAKKIVWSELIGATIVSDEEEEA